MSTGHGPDRRRLARMLLAAGLLLVVGGVLLLLRSLDPLSDTTPIAVPESIFHAPIDEIGGRAAIGIPYEHGGEAAFAFTVANDGPIGVTITGIEAGIGDLRLLAPYGVFVLPPDASLDGDDPSDLGGGSPLSSFALAAGERRVVVVRGTFDHCEFFHERNLELRDGIDVRYRVLGVPATQRIAFDRDLIVKSPMITSCPDRTLDREDDRRGPEGSG